MTESPAEFRASVAEAVKSELERAKLERTIAKSRKREARLIEQAQAQTAPGANLTAKELLLLSPDEAATFRTAHSAEYAKLVAELASGVQR